MSQYVPDVGSWLYAVPRFLQGAERQPAVREVTSCLVQKVDTANLAGSMFVRIAGLSGFLAVGFGAYGAHVFRGSDAEERLKLTFETGNRYHFFHTLGLLAVPLCRRPRLVGSLMTLGMVLFSGSCYIHALTDNNAIRQVTPYGGILLMVAWACMLF